MNRGSRSNTPCRHLSGPPAWTGSKSREADPSKGEEGSDSGSVLKVELLGFWKRLKAGRSWGDTATQLESRIARVDGTSCTWEGPVGAGRSARLVGRSDAGAGQTRAGVGWRSGTFPDLTLWAGWDGTCARAGVAACPSEGSPLSRQRVHLARLRGPRGDPPWSRTQAVSQSGNSASTAACA